MRLVPLEYLTEAYQMLMEGGWSLDAIERAEGYLHTSLATTRLCTYLTFEMWLMNEGFYAL